MSRSEKSGPSGAAKPRAPRAARSSPIANAAAAAPRKLAKKAAAPYHHGDLREALLRTAEAMLERDGLAKLTLRAVAREAGVSHAAPSHHFSDLAGLLSALAAVGFRRFAAQMQAAGQSAAGQAERGIALASAYLAFARQSPGMFTLMFRNELLDMEHPALRDSADAAFSGFASAIGAQRDGDAATAPLALKQAGQIARAWSLVHGFSMLLLDGRLSDMLRRLPAGTTPEMLFVEMLTGNMPRPPDWMTS